MNRAHALILAALFVVTAAGVQAAAADATSPPDAGHQLADRDHGSAPDYGDPRWALPDPQTVTPR